MKLDEFLNKALVALAGKRYPWLENTDGEGPACKEFIRQHIFKWDVCSDLHWSGGRRQAAVPSAPRGRGPGVGQPEPGELENSYIFRARSGENRREWVLRVRRPPRWLSSCDPGCAGVFFLTLIDANSRRVDDLRPISPLAL